MCAGGTLCKVPTIDIYDLDDFELGVLAASIHAEQQRRALAAADPSALVESGFQNGFKSDGTPVEPWLVDGILVCPGAKIGKSASSHECGFVRIDDQWVWESEAKVVDEVRHAAGRNVQMRSVTLIAVHETMKVDLILARMRSGVHQLKTAKSYTVSSGKLLHVTTRTPNVSFRDRNL